MMTAAAPPPTVNGSNDAQRRPHSDHSPSRFTAVNGREPPTPGLTTPAPDSHVHVPRLNYDQHREGTEAWRRSGYNTPPQQDTSLQDSRAAGMDREHGRAQRSPSQGELSETNRSKRKRSESGERQEIDGPPYQAPGASEVPVLRSDGNVDSRMLPVNPSAAAVSHSGHQTEHPSPPDHSRNLSTDAPWQERNPQFTSQTHRAQPFDPSDAHIAEALQRGAQDAQQGLDTVKYVTEAPTHGDEAPPLSTYLRERSQSDVQSVQSAPKRKRVFSNRTKTGCLTCRRRKKKCDEQHPICNNCIRGDFRCEGYSARGSWQRPPSTKTSVPLQSKEGYSEAGGQYANDLSQQHGAQRSLPERSEMGKIKSIITDDGGPPASQYSASPTDAGPSHGPWLKRSWAGQPSYLSEPVEKADPREVTLVHEVSRGGQPKTDYPVVAPLRESPYVSHPKPGPPLLQGGMDGRVAQPNMDPSSPQAQARMALNIEHQLSARAVSSDDTEKDKMIRGELYRPFDIQLVEERTRCKAALWRFNNACNGISGASTKEQSRLLKEVLVPPASSAAGTPSGVASPQSGGSIGQGAIVVAPFECHYGYNIHIGEDVMVSESCRFVDDCPISLGAHTWIGPAVTILGSVAHTNMQERKGSQSRYQGRPVTIEEDCYIGANCTIYPGVRIRRGAYVAPGEVVRSDIVAYGFQGFKPSYM